MTDISAFPTITSEIVKHIGTTFTCKTVTDLKPGQAVEFQASGVSWQVTVAKADGRAIGVVGAPHAAGDLVTVYSVGSIVKMANADDTAVIDAGDMVESNDNDVGGTINAVAEAGSGAKGVLHPNLLGVALDDIAASGTGYVLITLGALTQPLA